MVLGPVSTDAVNRAPRTSYGEVTGITQTVRNFGASVGLGVIGSLFITQNVARVEDTLEARGVPTAEAEQVAHAMTGAGAGGDASSFADRAGSGARGLFEAIQVDVGESTGTVALIMAGVMAVAFLVASGWMTKGRVEEAAPAAETTGPAIR